MSSKHAVLREKYLRRVSKLLTENKVNPEDPTAMVYMDESYLHHHYKRYHDSLYDASDHLDHAPKEKHKGRRYCFIAALVDLGPNGPTRLFIHQYTNC